MTVSIKLRGAGRIGNKIRRIAGTKKNIIAPAFKAWAQRVRKALKGTKYPRKRAGQRYKRTRRLANSWAVIKVRDTVYKVVNRAKSPKSGRNYAAFVVGNNQAWMHRGRWWQARDVVRDVSPGLVDEMAAHTRELMKE